MTENPGMPGTAQDVEMCDCTNEELEAGRICGQPHCPNRAEVAAATRPADDAAHLNVLNHVPPGTNLRGWILHHLAKYAPGAIGPTATDMAMVACASVSAMRAELEAARDHGLVRTRVLWDPPVPTTADNQHWELTTDQRP